MRRLIRERFPDDGVLGEEFGELAGTSGRRWVLDPIDGTKAFVGGRESYTVNIGLIEDGAPVAGAVAAPATGQVWYTAAGGAWRPGRRLFGNPPRSARTTSARSERRSASEPACTSATPRVR